MAHTPKTLAISIAALGLAFGACGDGDAADRTADTVENVAEDASDTAENAWASLRTEFEELVDEAATGDSEAQDQLLERCRETLEELRKADDPGAERVGQLCDNIRDADDQTAWDELR
ncbi:MAG: hypothetical protein KY412_07750, partial [Actinobacteria bacterium]|nr:hypothetical protein [Actinomycetota bacterium]